MPSCEICGKTFERHFGQGNLTEGGSAFKCPECTAKALDATPSPKDEAQRVAQQRAEELNRVSAIKPISTRIIVGICAAAFALELYKGASFSTISTDLAIRLGADYGPLTLTGQWWRVFTSMFLHFGVIHLALNMWCLWSLGSLAERLMGRAAFILLYFATGLAGGLLSLAVHPEVVSAGASGAVFGVSGGLITYLYLKKTPLGFDTVKGQLKSLWFFLAYNLLYSLRPGVDMMAHAGGLVMGLAIGAALPAHLPTSEQETAAASSAEVGANSRRRLTVVAFASMAAVLIGAAIIHQFRADDMFVIASLERIDTGHAQDVLGRLQSIAKKQPSASLARYALGSALLKTGHASEAVQEFEAADRLESDLYVSRGLADALRASGRNSEAAATARKILAEAPNDAKTLAILGQAEIGLGMTADGIRLLQAAVKLDANDPDLQARLREATAAVPAAPH